MPDDGSKLRDVSTLAEEGSEVAFAIPVARMKRLAGELQADGGMAIGAAQFARERGFAVASLQVTAEVTLLCQRCLKPLVTTISADSRVFLPHSEAAAQRVPADAELMLAPEGRLRMSELVEEDLMLALPLAPLHADDEYCAMRPEEPEGDLPPVDVQKPFAALGDLMGQARRDEPKRQEKRRGRGD
jgi:uncharacterized protein